MSRLYLHIGLAKTGTTFLQAVLAENRPRLREAGFVYPFVRREGMFHAAVEIRREYDRWGLPPELIDGTWEAMVAKAREVGGTAIISHEILAGAEPDQIAWANEKLDGLELHLVVTVRDLARLLPAHWVEAVKNGHAVTFAELTREVLRDPGAEDTRFWASHDLVAILERWAPLVPPERVHIVVAPKRGAERSELWHRFADAVGLPEDAVDLEIDRGANESLGAEEVHLLREINAALDGSIQQPYYSRVVKRLFAQRLLSQVESPRAVTPEDLRPELSALAEEWIAKIRDSGYSVHGNLDELLPTEFGSEHPDDLAKPVLPGTLTTFTAALKVVADLRAAADSEAAAAEAAAPEAKQSKAKRLLRRR